MDPLGQFVDRLAVRDVGLRDGRGAALGFDLLDGVVGQQGNYGQANYAATKSGMFGFTRSLALELASSGSTANCVAPGFTETDMLAEVREDIRERIRQKIPLNRFAEVEDVACAVRFLASEESSYMTGQVVSVNGGMEW